jgi:hypothetical protein
MEDMEDMEHQDEGKNHMLTTMENNNAISWTCEHEHEWVNMSRWTRNNL